MEAVKTGILPQMWFCRLCTAGVNIFGIAMQVPFGKEMGFGGGIVALAMSLKAFINGTGRGVIGWISDRCGRRETLVNRVRGAGAGAVLGVSARLHGEYAAIPAGDDQDQTRARRGGGCHSGPPQLAALPHTDRARTARQQLRVTRSESGVSSVAAASRSSAASVAEADGSAKG